MTTLYSTKAIAVGGRAGHVRTEDGLFSANLALPKALGGKGNATNPEQLFAAGYAACFGNAIIFVAKDKKIALADDAVEVTSDVGIGARAEGGFKLSVSLAVNINGVSQAVAEELTQIAHAICPYSNAIRGNIDVGLTVNSR
jgi:lipoyl-dependent peroxiredoxin